MTKYGLTYIMLVSEERVVFGCQGTVPPHVTELVLALRDADLGAFPYHRHCNRTAPTDGTLLRREARYLVANVGS